MSKYSKHKQTRRGSIERGELRKRNLVLKKKLKEKENAIDREITKVLIDKEEQQIKEKEMYEKR